MPTRQVTDWAEVVSQIQSGDQAGFAKLYEMFATGVRYQICRQLGPRDLEDNIHDTFLTIIGAIQGGELREPERLMGFVRIVVRRKIAAYVNTRVLRRNRQEVSSEPVLSVEDRGQNPEQAAAIQQRADLVQHALGKLTAKDREILTRFYLLEQPREQIAAEMGLSDGQFRVVKSRALVRFGDHGKHRLAHGAEATPARRHV